MSFFLSRAVIPDPDAQLTKEELRFLIALAHPDKHEGRAEAGQVTAKLLNMMKATKQ